MGESNITIAGDWSKPVNTLIEKISDATGAVFKPWQIKRIAKANSEAKNTEALVDLKISERQQRAMHRLLHEETKKQENIENISQKSFKDVKEDANPENIDDDWLSNFFDKCKNISNEDMQNKWAKILSEEANNPGIFSKKTLEIMSLLEKKDAVLFQSLCNFTWTDGGHAMTIIDNYNNGLYSKSNINYGTLTDLQDLGLVNFSNNGTLTRSWKSGLAVLGYANNVHLITHPSDNVTLNVGNIQLTRAGEELAKIIELKMNDEYYNYMLEDFKKKGFSITIHAINTDLQTGEPINKTNSNV